MGKGVAHAQPTRCLRRQPQLALRLSRSQIKAVWLAVPPDWGLCGEWSSPASVLVILPGAAPPFPGPASLWPASPRNSQLRR